MQDLGTGAELALVGPEPEMHVGLDGVHAAVLQSVGAQLVGEPDAATFLADVEHDAAPLLLHPLHRRVQLVAAITAQRTERIAGQALRVHPNEHVFLDRSKALPVADAVDTDRQGHVCAVVDPTVVAVAIKVAIARRHLRHGHAFDHALATPAVFDQVRDAAHLDVALFGEHCQFWHAGHFAVGLGDLANDPSGRQTGQTAQIDDAFRLPGAHQRATIHRPQREDMARPRQVRRLRIRVHRGENGRRAILGRDASRDPFGRLDADRKSRAKTRSVRRHHHRQRQTITDLVVERQADQPTSLTRHLGDQFRRSELSCETKVPFVFTIGVIHQDDRPAGFQFF